MKAIIISFIATTVLFGCSKNSKTAVSPAEQMRSLSAVHVAARVKELVKSNDIIDLDATKVSNPSAKLSDEDYAEMKAALYRFYKNVKVENGKYIYHGSTVASDIKLSDRLFKSLLKNLNDMNKEMDKMRAKGQKVQVTPVNDSYLNALLN